MNILTTLNWLSLWKKIWIIVWLILVFLWIIIYSNTWNKNEDRVYNVNTKTFQETTEISSSQKLEENTIELKSDKETSLTINEWEIINVSEWEKEKLKTENLQKEIIKETIKKEEEKNLWWKTEVTNANDVELTKKEIQISWNLSDVKLSYKEIQKNIWKEFNKLWVKEQEVIINSLNSKLWNKLFTKKNYNTKMKKLLKYLTNEKEYVMIEKITQWWIENILNWNFLQTLKSDRMLYNNAILEIL